MNILSFVYRQSTIPRSSNNLFIFFYSKGFDLMRRAILKIADPACTMDIRGRALRMPFSHQLPLYARMDSEYDKVLRRLSDFIRASQGRVCGIDVGANIGDTLLACASDREDMFLAIEPNPVFFKYLEVNARQIPNVCLRRNVCGSEDRKVAYQISTTRGTARFEESTLPGAEMETRRLDTLLKELPEFNTCNFLKIDTDGHDFEVMRGARELISSTRPIVIFECDLFDNPNYVTDAIEALRFFAATGYQDALIYDNAGFLFGRLDLCNSLSFTQDLFYQLTSRKLYFDVLVMPDAELFYQRELKYFIGLLPQGHSHSAAEAAAQKIMGLTTD